MSVTIQSNDDKQSDVLSSQRKLCKDSMFLIELGRLFRAIDAATGNAIGFIYHPHLLTPLSRGQVRGSGAYAPLGFLFVPQIVRLLTSA